MFWTKKEAAQTEMNGVADQVACEAEGLYRSGKFFDLVRVQEQQGEQRPRARATRRDRRPGPRRRPRRARSPRSCRSSRQDCRRRCSNAGPTSPPRSRPWRRRTRASAWRSRRSSRRWCSPRRAATSRRTSAISSSGRAAPGCSGPCSAGIQRSFI